MPFTGGLPETGCGAGSTYAYTMNVRAWLPELMRELDVKTLLDAPCGDFNWMSQTNLSGIDYIGIDYDPEHCPGDGGTRIRTSISSALKDSG